MICNLIVTMFLLNGCVIVSNACPSFPRPSKEAIMDLQELNSNSVNEWVVELYKLELKLKECNNAK